MIEVRSDNGKQFNCHLMTEFFESNHINHVYTHPYTPEENGHIESFHDILSTALKRDRFNDLADLKKRLIKFYECYNNDRSHSGTQGIPPAKFSALHDLNKVDIIPLDKNKAKIQLKVAYQDILTLPDIFNINIGQIEPEGDSRIILRSSMDREIKVHGRPTHYTINFGLNITLSRLSQKQKYGQDL